MTLFRLLVLATLFGLFCLSESHLLSAADRRQDLAAPQVLRGRKHQLTYQSQIKIPAFEIDGLPARIHTQGIYVTKNSIYVTGRLERIPKRALFLRFDRNDLSQVEFLDITPTPNAKQHIEAGLDHPGGFDYDGLSFWIPVAISKPHSSTAIIKVHSLLDTSLANATTELAFVLGDHFGALAVDRKNKRIFGANWDTQVIAVWDTKGTVLERIPRDQLIHANSNWALAVQDWKCLSGSTILAGGKDKDPRREKSQSRAVLDWIDIEQHQLLDRIRIIDPDGKSQTLTHEGMALYKNDLFLLPGDLGDSATIYRYRLEVLPE